MVRISWDFKGNIRKMKQIHIRNSMYRVNKLKKNDDD